MLEGAGISFEAGLSSQEIGSLEAQFGFVFPDDLRSFLMFALPTGQGFVNWRSSNRLDIAEAMAWPLEGMWFDVKTNHFWPSDWGMKPSEESAAYELLRSQVESAPKLIPICGHRYMPDRPSLAGNPVYSVFQTDIIFYGSDLENYLYNEFARQGTNLSLSEEIRQIEFWSSFVS
jgi:hypothetical protein